MHTLLPWAGWLYGEQKKNQMEETAKFSKYLEVEDIDPTNPS